MTSLLNTFLIISGLSKTLTSSDVSLELNLVFLAFIQLHLIMVIKGNTKSSFSFSIKYFKIVYYRGKIFYVWRVSNGFFTLRSSIVISIRWSFKSSVYFLSTDKISVSGSAISKNVTSLEIQWKTIWFKSTGKTFSFEHEVIKQMDKVIQSLFQYGIYFCCKIPES